jgi:nucleotide-binding universal stress UspA family protein
MDETAIPTHDATSAPGITRSPSATRVLLATDGGADAMGAVAVAAAMARFHAEVRALTVIPFATAGMTGSDPLALTDAELRAERYVETRTREAVQHQLAERLSGVRASFVQGRVVPTIVRSARDWEAEMILVGLNKHDLIDRLTGEETALRVARSAAIPVLAVIPDAAPVPHRIVVAVDFSAASIRAARAALALAGDGAHVTLAHVRPPAEPARPSPGDPRHYTAGIAGGLAQLQQRLAPPPGGILDTVSLVGDTVMELTNYATVERADLIAVGSHRHSFVGRLILGGVTTDLLRAASHSVLVIPPEQSQAA